MIQVEGIFAGGATKPYIEETYDSYDNLIDVKMHGYTKIRDYAFSNCANLALTSLPDDIVGIGEGAFLNCLSLAITSLPDGLMSIGGEAFYNCPNLALTSLPDGLTSIGGYAFGGCTGLTSLTFMGTPTSIASDAFEGCENLTTINVPWAEGAVEGAPWGAANATIHYNYTGG